MTKSKKSKSKKDKKEKKTKAQKAKEEKKKKKSSKKSKKDKKKKKKTDKKKSKNKSKKKKSEQKKKKSDKSQKEKKDKKKVFKNVFDKKTLVILLVVAVLGLAYIYRGMFVAAIVNGMPISRWQILKRAEQAQGQQILDSIITEKLVKQKAEKEGITVSDEDLSQEIDQIKKSVEGQDQSFDQILAMQGMTLEDLKDRLRLNKMIEQLLAGEVEVTEEQVNQYIEDNKDFFPEDMSEEEKKQSAKDQLRQQQMNQKYQEWVKQLKDKARIRNFVNYGQ
jgi:hypothetical protein